MLIRKHSLRFSLVFVFFFLCLFVFSVRLVLIQVFRSSYLASLAEKQHNHYIKLEPKRGNIYDRHKRPLALNVPVYSLYANPRQMSDENKEEAVNRLSVLLNKDVDFLQERLSRKKYFIWLARKLSSEMMETIKSWDIKGLAFIKENKRYHPNQYLASHILGFTDIDNKGLEGLEYYFDKKLRGEFGWARILRDARHRELMMNKHYFAPKDGHNLVLTIDETIQFIVERALDKAFNTNNAKSASIIVMDPKTGEILALANRPTYDLRAISKSSMDDRANRAVSHMYEPGSVFKIVTAAAALEEDAFREKDKIFCENGKYRIANHTLHDHKPHGSLSFAEVIHFSSNIGTAKVAQELGAKKIYQYSKQFRFGQKTRVDLPGEISGVLKPPHTWSKTSISAVPMGHEVAVTPLQLAAGISAIANDGVYMKPHIVKYVNDKYDEIIEEFKPQIVDRIISEKTAQRVKIILEGVVEKGTAPKAKIRGIRVAGKTGTAQKVVDGTYSHSKFYASFIGFAPVEDPKVAMVVVFDEPHPNYYGGTVAAPVFKEIMQDVLRYLDSSPETRTQTVRVY